MLRCAWPLQMGLLIMLPLSVLAQQPPADTTAAESDQRVLVTMPGVAQTLLREDMRQHLASLSAIITALAEQRLEAAADIASQQLGSASMGRHRASGGGPGRHMPAAMRSIGMRMHAAADTLAEAARAGDQTAAMQQLGQLTAACSACHAGYRIR